MIHKHIDGDGLLDVITELKNPIEGDIVIFRNPGDNFHDYWDFYVIDNVGKDARQFSVGDIDLDGYNDIAAACASKNEIVWYRNNGTTWYNSWGKRYIDKHDTCTEYTHFVELFDIDEDGRLDLLFSTCPPAQNPDRGYFVLYFNRLDISQ
jgi:hypothetical protein